MAPDVYDSWIWGGSHRPCFGPDRRSSRRRVGSVTQQGAWFVALADRVGQHRVVLPGGRGDQVDSGAAPVVREARGESLRLFLGGALVVEAPEGAVLVEALFA